MLWLRADNLSHLYGYRPVFDHVSFRVEQGAVLSVSGPNGSGKSTLLRIAAGLLRPTGGELQCGDSQPWSPEQRRSALGYLSPEVNLYAPLTARENLEFFARVRGLTVDVRARLETVELAARAEDPVSSFSSGMKQRLKLACALLAEPAILLLDEPGVTLDDRGRELIRRVLADQRTRGLALLASNEPEEVALGDDILLLGA